jgi:uncharacterized protein YjbJ (UPF0337 family)
MESMANKIKDTFNELKGKIRQKYADQVDDNLLNIEEKEDQWTTLLQLKLGRIKEGSE